MPPPLHIDLSRLPSLEALHADLHTLFGFPDFYGHNYAALVDCLSSVPYPEDHMTTVSLNPDSPFLDITLQGLFSAPREVANTLLSACEAVNQRQMANQLPPFIRITLI